MYFMTLNHLSFIQNNHHENLAAFIVRHKGGPKAAPYAGYYNRHLLNENGPMREVKDMTMEEIRKLEVKYGAPIRSLTS